jgi:putative RecB family exonuclease
MTRMEGRIPAPAETADLFQTLWTRQLTEDADIRYDEDMDADTCANQGREMAACLVNNIDPDEEVVTVSEAFCVPLTDASGHALETPLIGEIDCVVSKSGRKSLVDWKTSGRRWPKGKADMDWQPTAFLYGYSLKHDETPDFRFDVVVKNKTPVFEQHVTSRGPDQFLRLVEMAKLAESMIKAGHFAPNEQSFYCGGCPHQEACKSWHRGPTRLPVRLAA